MLSDDRRCVITGLGMVCAIGNSVDECWENAKLGKSGIAHTSTVDTEGCYADYAAEVHCDDLPDRDGYIDRASRLCIKATKEAMSDAGLNGFGGDNRCGVIMGSCVGGVVSIEKYYTQSKDPEYIKQMPISAIASEVAAAVDAGGVCCNIANACAAGTISIAHAAELIRDGKADVVVAGGADAFASVPYAGFISLHALSSDPCSPFNHSNGLTLGEGSGALIVESYTHAKARGAKIYCEVLGSGVSSDAHHITAPRPDGEGQINAIERAIANSGAKKSDIGYINAHGTGTAKNDEAEFLSLHKIFDGINSDLSVSSTKAMTGHCLGAAGAIEAVFTVKALENDTVPPTVGYSEADLTALKEKAGDIDFVPNAPHKKKLKCAVSNSFAFGGNNASVVFGKTGGTEKEKHGASAYITGIGAVTPLCNGVANYAAAVNADKRIDTATAFSSVTTEDFNSVGLKMAFYRKLDRLSQLQAVSGMQALFDAEYAVTDENAVDTGIIVGTSEGALGAGCDFEILIAERGNAAGSAFKFPNTVYNAAGGYLSICSGIKGYNVTVTNGAQSATEGIGYAIGLIGDGECKAVLACGSDENSEIMTELYGGLGVVADSFKQPYTDGETADFVLSDGSVSILVESGESVKKRGGKIYCRAAGYGFAHKSVPFGTLSGSESALETALKNAIADAKLDIGDIDAVVGLGNGHAAIDALEVKALEQVFGKRLKSLPVLSVKSRIGEARAAAASLAVAHSALMLGGDIPADEAYILDGGAKKVRVKSSSLNNIAVIAFGSGGTYSAVVLQRANGGER